MKAFCFVISVAIAAVYVPAGCYGQVNACTVAALASLDPQCTNMLNSINSQQEISTETRANFCNGGCAQAVFQAFEGCAEPGDNVTALVIQGYISFCTVNEQGDFCQEVFTNETLENITTTCFADLDCTGACYPTIEQLIGCCGSVGGLDTIFTSCTFTNCPSPFDQPPVTQAPSTQEPATTEGPLPPLFICLFTDVFNNQNLQQDCGQYLPSFEDEEEMPTMDNLFDFNIQEFCASSCSQRIAEQFNGCEREYGSFGAAVLGDEYEDIYYSTLIQAGCSKDSVDSSRVCLDVLEDDSYGAVIEQAVSSDACQQSLQNNECDLTCEAAIKSLSCCVNSPAFLVFAGDQPETRLLDLCKLQSCDAPFELGGATTIHGSAVAVLMMISASLGALMV